MHYQNFKNLAARTETKRLRFWGKILGTKSDYYVCEGLLSNQNFYTKPSKDAEPFGVGVNRLTFWVASNG